MLRAFPPPVESVDPLALLMGDPRPAISGHPWVMCNMVGSVDGATDIEGRSGELGGPADRVVFRAVRSVPDVILVAGGTARAENYGPISLPSASMDARRKQGRPDVPQLAVVSASLSFDVDSRLFDSGHRPIIITSESSDPEQRRRLAEVAGLVVIEGPQVTAETAVGALGRAGHEVILCEGGPSLNGQMFAADLVQEFLVTTGPLVVGGDGQRMVRGPHHPPRAMTLDRLMIGENAMFARWLRTTDLEVSR